MRRVLIIDDEKTMAGTLADYVREMGYEARISLSRAEALEVLGEPWRPHVILLDQKLDGGGGPDSGLDLLGRLVDSDPACRVLLVTGYATSASTRSAFSRGATDVIVKDDLLGEMLRHKVRTAGDAAELAMGAPSNAQLDAALSELWARTLSETDPLYKGGLLEQTITALFRTLPGLGVARSNVRNGHEEFDVVVRNESADPILSRQGDWLLVECKNWSDKAGVATVNTLVTKVRRRHGRCRLGLFVSLNGFATTVAEDLVALRKSDTLEVTLTGSDVDAWIAAPDRLRWLKERIERAVLS